MSLAATHYVVKVTRLYSLEIITMCQNLVSWSYSMLISLFLLDPDVMDDNILHPSLGRGQSIVMGSV